MNSLRFSFDGREESEAEYQARIKHRNSGYANNFNKKALITGVTGQDGSYLQNCYCKRIYGCWFSEEPVQRIIKELNCIKNARFSLEEVDDSGSVYFGRATST